MPTIKDYNKKNVSKKPQAKADEVNSEQRLKRRPGRAEHEHELELSDVEYVPTGANPGATAEPEKVRPKTQKEESYRMDFFGSEVLRAKIPKVVELAEAVIEDWSKDGDFRALPLSNPWVQLAATKGLTGIKQVEQRLKLLRKSIKLPGDRVE